MADDAQTIEDALGPPEFYGAERVAFLNDAGDLVLQVRWNNGAHLPMQVRSSTVVTGTDAHKIAELNRFRRALRAAA